MMTRLSVGSRSEVSGETVMAVFSILVGSTPETIDEAFTIFNRRFAQVASGKIKIWQNQDLTQQWAFEATGAGMWGEMTVVGVVDLETSGFLGIKVVNQNETAGLGSKIAEPSFTEQFAGLSFASKIEMSRARYKNNQFDAVSGATVTSKSLEILLNKAVAAVKSQAGKG
jgi:Na+-translocating ferredoxin:NAD+ oxidoreductase RnfG subunit